MEKLMGIIFGWHERHENRIEMIERNLSEIMASIADLNDAIAALPQKVADDVIPLIPTGTGTGGGGEVDTTAQIEALAQVPSQVSSLVQAAISAASTPSA